MPEKRKRVHTVKKLQYNSPVILSFFLLSLAALLLGYITGGRSTSLVFSVYRFHWKNLLGYVRLFGHVLGHGDWNHFIGNMLLLLVVQFMLLIRPVTLQESIKITGLPRMVVQFT